MKVAIILILIAGAFLGATGPAEAVRLVADGLAQLVLALISIL